MISRWLTAPEARLLAQINTWLFSQHKYQLAESALDELMSFFEKNRQAMSANVSAKDFIMPLPAVLKIQEVFGYELTWQAAQTPSYGTGTWVKILTVSWENQSIGETVRVIMQSDVANSALNILADTGLSFPVKAGKSYYFKAFIPFTAAATGTGSRWTIDGPTATMSYRSIYPLTATTFTSNFASAYNIPAACNANSLLINNATIEGVLSAQADGIVKIRFASEVSGSAITAKAGGVLEYVRTA